MGEKFPYLFHIKSDLFPCVPLKSDFKQAAVLLLRDTDDVIRAIKKQLVVIS